MAVRRVKDVEGPPEETYRQPDTQSYQAADPDGDTVELSETQIEQPYHDRLRVWLDQENLEKLQVTSTLYKFENPVTGEEKAQCGSWVGDVPDAHTVGLTYGSGRYSLLVTTPPGKNQARKIKGYRFKIHPYYDDLRRQAAQGSLPGGMAGASAQFLPYNARPGNGGQSESPTSALSAGLGAVKELIAVIAPLMAARASGPSGGGPDARLMGEVMGDVYRNMGQVMADNVRNTQKLLTDLRRGDFGAGEEQEGQEVEDEGKSVLEQLKPLLAEFVPLLLGKGPAAKVTAATVRNLPQFRQAISDKGELRRIVEYLDKSLGADKSNALLGRLKVTRPK